jgi:hypothetical protein
VTNDLSGPLRQAERNILMVVLLLRVADVSLAVVATIVGWRAYHPPWIDLAVLIAAAAESTVMVSHTRARQAYNEPAVAAAEVVFGVLGLLCLGSALGAADRTTFLNWMVPYCAALVASCAMAFRSTRAGIAATTAMASVYAYTVRANLRLGGAQAATAAANVLEFAAFYVIAERIANAVRQSARATVQAQEAALVSAERQAATEATTKERDHWHRQLHNRALQTLEGIAKNQQAPEGVRNDARRDASWLRALVMRDVAGHGLGLVDALSELVEDFAGQGLNVELVIAEVRDSPTPAVVAAIEVAANEALCNVAKHAQANRVVMRALAREGRVEVSVRDHGVGFDPEAATAGFGIAKSIRWPMTEVGGAAEVWSLPGEGTLVTLRVPA